MTTRRRALGRRPRRQGWHSRYVPSACCCSLQDRQSAVWAMTPTPSWWSPAPTTPSVSPPDRSRLARCGDGSNRPPMPSAASTACCGPTSPPGRRRSTGRLPTPPRWSMPSSPTKRPGARTSTWSTGPPPRPSPHCYWLTVCTTRSQARPAWSKTSPRPPTVASGMSDGRNVARSRAVGGRLGHRHQFMACCFRNASSHRLFSLVPASHADNGPPGWSTRRPVLGLICAGMGVTAAAISAPLARSIVRCSGARRDSNALSAIEQV